MGLSLETSDFFKIIFSTMLYGVSVGAFIVTSIGFPSTEISRFFALIPFTFLLSTAPMVSVSVSFLITLKAEN